MKWEQKVTDKQWERIGQLCVAYQQKGGVEFFNDSPFDLPKGWVMVRIAGITYGIDPDGRASS